VNEISMMLKPCNWIWATWLWSPTYILLCRCNQLDVTGRE
jgi:hypothetical protein